MNVTSTPLNWAARRARQHQLVRVDSDGELYIVSYSNGTILKIIGPSTAPATPTGLRIIR